MKELSIEEKAKRYDEAIERAKSLLSGNQLGNAWIYKLLPELKESEDERIRKELICFLETEIPQCNARDKYIAWLEKQGKNNMGISETTKLELEGNLNKALEKETPESWNKFLDEQGEQKPNCCDGQKPKTHNGSDNPYDMSYPDAEGYISKRGFDVPWCDCDVFVDNRYITQTVGNILRWADDNPKQKPAEWSEEDKKRISSILLSIEDCEEQYPNLREYQYDIDWLKSLKERVQSQQKWSEEDEQQGEQKSIESTKTKLNESMIKPNPNPYWTLAPEYKLMNEQNPAWSEEDEKMLSNTIKDLVHPWNEYIPDRIEEEIKWLKNKLKSLRSQNWAKKDTERYISCLQRLGTGNPEQPETINSKWFKEHVYPQTSWKPSDAQIASITCAVRKMKESACYDSELVSLYQDLKKLKDE